MVNIKSNINLPESDIEIKAVRSQGAGGQNVNKVATAIHLRFDINSSSLPDEYKQKLLTLKDRRITSDGVIIIKAQKFRTQEKNKEDAIKRLVDLIRKASAPRKKRKKTNPTFESKAKRLEEKTKRSKLKISRGKIEIE